MKGEFETLDTSDKQLRKFGLLVGGAILLVAGYLGVIKHKELHELMPFLGLVLTGFAFGYPKLLKWPYYAWMGIAIVLGYFVGNALLFILYYLFVTPIALLRSLFRPDEPKDPKTYWITREKGWTKETMEQLF